MKKNTFLILLVVFTLAVELKAQAIDSLDLDFNGKTVYQLNIKNLPRPVVFKFYYFSHYPPLDVNDSIQVKTDGTYYLKQGLVKPEIISVAVENSAFKLYTSPGDTLIINMNFKAQNLVDDISFEGKKSAESKYHKEKSRAVKEKFYTKDELKDMDMNQFVREKDSVFQARIAFFEDYIKTDSLPERFSNQERWDIKYANLQSKLSIAVMKKTVLDSVEIEDGYYSFLSDAKIYNPEAKYSNSYYDFLDDYFDNKVPIEILHNKKGTIKAIRMFEYSRNAVDSLLKDNIRDMYVARELAALIDGSDMGFWEIDELIKENENKFINTDLWQFLVGLRKFYSFMEDPKRKQKAIRKGEFSPFFRLEDTLGRFKTMEDYRGYWVYMHFWALSSQPSITALKQFKTLEDKFAKSSKVIILHICLGEDTEAWKEHIRESGLRGSNLLSIYNSEQFREMFNFVTVPHYLIVNPETRLHQNAVEGPDKIIPVLEKLIEGKEKEILDDDKK